MPVFYMIVANIKKTKLVFNLVYRKDKGSSFERRGYWSHLRHILLAVGGYAHLRGPGSNASGLALWLTE